MRPVITFVRKTAIGGVLFLLPVALIAFLLGHLFTVVRPVASTAAELIGQSGVRPLWLTTATIAVLIASAFLAGLFAATAAGRSLVNKLEIVVLNQVPGYALLKRSAAEVAGNVDSSKRIRTALIGGAEGWQIGFIMAELEGDSCVVFVPEAPSLTSGSVIFVPRNRIANADISTSEALDCLRRLGARPPKFVVPAS